MTMLLREAKKIVLKNYPSASIYHHALDSRGTYVYYIAENEFYWKWLASVYRPKNYYLSNEEMIDMLWKQAAQQIIRDMLHKLKT